MSGSVSVGELRAAMDAVVPEVPQMASRRLWGARPSQLEQNPNAVREALVDAINDGERKIDDPNSPKHIPTLAKLETYTLLGAISNHMVPIMVEGNGADARFRMEAQANVEEDLEYISLTQGLGPIHNYGFDTVLRQNRWARIASTRYNPVFEVYFPYTQSNEQLESGSDHMRVSASGGGLGRTISDLALLAHKLDVQKGLALTPNMSDAEITQRMDGRRQAMHALAYLGISRAGINIDTFESRFIKPLSSLEGGLVSKTTPTGRQITVFRQSNSSIWGEVFPSTGDGSLPTLKCPVHQDSQLKDMVHAGIEFAAENGYLPTNADRRIMSPGIEIF